MEILIEIIEWENELEYHGEFNMELIVLEIPF